MICSDEASSYGDVWTWVAIDADTKLVPTYYVGRRYSADGYRFMTDVAGRLRNRVQLSMDGHKPYLRAVEGAFGSEIDYATIQQLYGSEPGDEKRYSPATCVGIEKNVVMGDPDRISTSYVERQNLTMRMRCAGSPA